MRQETFRSIFSIWFWFWFWLLRPGFIKIKARLFLFLFVFNGFRATALFSGFGSAARGFVYLFPFLAQSRAVNTPVRPLEKLRNQRGDDRTVDRWRHPHSARDPCWIIRQAAPWRHPHQAQKAVVCAVLLKRQVRRVRLKVGWIHGEIRDTHCKAPILARATFTPWATDL